MRAGTVAAAALALAALAGCEFDRTTVPMGRERLVVHAVLNPSRAEQIILVERTLTGRVTIDTGLAFDPRDPIATGGGVPVLDAEVVVTSVATGDSAYAMSEATQAERGRGVYLFINGVPPRSDAAPGSAGYSFLRIVPGTRYRLRVRTPDGEVTGEATVPATAPVPPRRTADTLNVDRDTLALRWRPVPAASRYALHVASVYGPFFLFTDSVRYALSGQLRNLFANQLPTVFVPGFRQTVQVAAVDTNFFDYYRSVNNPFTGTGIINRLTGGTGLFGAYVPLDTRMVEVTADEDEPVEGLYVARQGAALDSLQLYVVARAREGVGLSGNHRERGTRSGVLGTLVGATVTIARLGNQSVTDSLGATIHGTFAGDSIAFDQGFTTRVVFRKAAALSAQQGRAYRSTPPRWHSAQTP